MTNKQTRDISLLSRATLFTITIHARFGNRKVIPKGKYYSEAADNRTNATMKLIESPELDRIEKYQNEIKQWCLARCMPSFITKGVYVLALTEAEEVDSALREANSILKNELVPAFLAAADEIRTWGTNPCCLAGRLGQPCPSPWASAAVPLTFVGLVIGIPWALAILRRR